MSDSETIFVVQPDTNLHILSDASINTIKACMTLRQNGMDDLGQLWRVLRSSGMLQLQTVIAPTKKPRQVYVQTLMSVLYTRQATLYNEYEWLRAVKSAGFHIMKQAKYDVRVEIDIMDISHERIEKAKILLHQCPGDLLEFVEPIFPPQGRLGYTTRQLELVLQK